MKTSNDFIFHQEQPWISVGSDLDERQEWIPSYFYSKDGVNSCVRRLRGNKMRNTESLMNEFSASLQFFDGFGENWHALEECLFYLDEWLPADVYTLVINNSEKLLIENDAEQMIALLTTLHRSGEWWSKPILDNERFNRKSIPFHTLLIFNESNSKNMNDIIYIATNSSVPIRLLDSNCHS